MFLSKVPSNLWVYGIYFHNARMKKRSWCRRSMGKIYINHIARYIATRRIYSGKSQQYILVYKSDATLWYMHQMVFHFFQSKNQSSYEEHGVSFSIASTSSLSAPFLPRSVPLCWSSQCPLNKQARFRAPCLFLLPEMLCPQPELSASSLISIRSSN